MFITFEGIEGSGKSTQLLKLADWFSRAGREVVTTREPGGTRFGHHVRALLLNPETVGPDIQILSSQTEILLFTADRIEHIHQLIQPALEAGKVVLCDRFIDSTYAYQRVGRKNPPELVNQLCQMVPLMPDLTIVFDLPAEEGLARAKSRSTPDRFEKESLAFHHTIRQAYLDLAREFERIAVIPISGLNPDQVFEHVVSVVTSRLIKQPSEELK